MNVDVIYQGLALVKGAPARSEGAALFVEVETPMPVGTPLELVTPDGTKSGRVQSVIEGAGAGMLIALGARKTAEPNAPMQEMKSAPQPVAPPPSPALPASPAGGSPMEGAASPAADSSTEGAAAEKEDDEPDDKPGDAAPKKKGRKQRKTVIGH